MGLEQEALEAPGLGNDLFGTGEPPVVLLAFLASGGRGDERPCNSKGIGGGPPLLNMGRLGPSVAESQPTSMKMADGLGALAGGGPKLLPAVRRGNRRDPITVPLAPASATFSWDGNSADTASEDRVIARRSEISLHLKGIGPANGSGRPWSIAMRARPAFQVSQHKLWSVIRQNYPIPR